MVNDPEKNIGSKPLRATSLQVADGVSDPDQYTLSKRPWRLRSTPFSEILRQEYRGDGSEENPFIITWLQNDPENPQTYGLVYKWTVTMVVAIVTLAVALASSAYSGAVESIERDFHPSTEVAILGVSLFVVGFALGPLIWAPTSEVFGRRIVLLFTYAMFTLWNAVAAASPNMASLIIFRFLAGAFGSSPLTNAGGTISDMFSAKMRGLATAIFAAAPFLGPALGPIIGGFLGMTSGWRWVQGFLGIFSGVLTVISYFFVPETYSPTLLRNRAAQLSKVTGKHYRASMDAKKPLHIPTLFKVSLSRPWQLLFLEPIVLLISIYMAIVYGTLYMLFAAFPIVFQQYRGWNAGVGGLAFLGVLVGMLIGVVYTIVYENPRYIKVVDKHGGRAPPEARLPQAMIGAVLLVIGLIWFAASDGPSVHWIVPILAGVPFGCGMLFVFLALMNYLIDCYVVYAASVLAANSVLRSLFGAAFPLFTTPMFKNLGIHWAVAIPAGLALLCLPFPFIFYKFGEPIRKRCKYTKKAEEVLKMMMAGNPEAKRKPAGDAPNESEADRQQREVDREENEGVEEAENDINAGSAQPERSQSLSSRQSDSENTLASSNGVRKASK